jgi:hypothetical protein
MARLRRRALQDLFVAQGDDGVDAGGAAGGNEARQQSDGGEQAGDAGKGERVGDTDTKQHAGQEPRKGQGRKHAESDAEKRETSALGEYETQDVAALGAKRDANAEFLGALGDAIGDQAIDAHAGENQRDRRKNSKKKHGEARAGKGIREKLVHGSDGSHREFRVHLLK